MGGSCESQQEREKSPAPAAITCDQRDSTYRRSFFQAEPDLLSVSLKPPQSWQKDLSETSRLLLRQVLGLNPFKTSYFALYRPLQTLDAKLLLAGGIVLAIAAGVPLPIIGVLFSKIINSFPPSEEELKLRIGQLLGIAIAYFALTWGWALCWGLVGERVSKGLREALVERTMGMDQSFFDCEGPNLSSLLTEKIHTIQLGTSEKVGLFIQSMSYFLAAFTVGFILNARLTGILFAAVIPTMTLIICYGTKSVSRLSKKTSASSETAETLAQSAIHAIQVVQAFGMAQRLSDDHLQLISSRVRIGIQKAIAGAATLASVYFVAYAANALAFWQGYKEHAHSGDGLTGDAGTVYAVVFLILDASFVLGQFGPFLQTFALASSAGERIFEILNHDEPEIRVLSPNGESPCQRKLPENIHFQNVSFAYPARRTQRILNDLTVTFKAGCVNGIVGHSGSGKSTIASLLLRFYDPCSGLISIGQKDLRNYNVHALRSCMAFVGQDPVLFSGTVLENISYGMSQRDSLSDEQIQHLCSRAARDAGCDFIANLPEGMHTVIGPLSGMQLSGGQKQRICLARALVGNPSVLILDEYTSAMDASTEALVLDRLKESSKESGRTTIIIAHRLVTVQDADNIILMGNGAALDQGTHESLLERNQLYQSLVAAQQLSVSSSQASSGVTLKHSAFKQESPEVLQPPAIRSERLVHETAVPLPGIWRLIYRILNLAKPNLKVVLVGVLASILAGSVVLGEAVVFGNLIQILNAPLHTESLQNRADFFCLMFFVLSLVAFLAYFSSGTAFGIISERFQVRMQNLTLRAVLERDLAWFTKPGQTPFAITTRMASDAGHLGALSGIILGTLLSVFTSVVGGILVAHIVAWKIAVVLLAAVPIMLLAGFFRLRVLARAEKRQRSAYSHATAMVLEACAAIKTVAALGREREVIMKYKEAIRKPYEESVRFVTGGSLLFSASFAVTYFVYALAYWWGSQQVRAGRYTDVQFFIVLPALLFSAQAAGQMFSLAPEITQAKAAARSTYELQNQQPSNHRESTGVSCGNKPHQIDRSTSEKPTSKTPARVEFMDVSLHYNSNSHRAALNNVNISIEAGQSVAFVGPSGAGKSSSLALLERFYDPTTGTILIDGQDVRYLSRAQHRARIGLVAQESDLFPGSVSFNLSLGARPGQVIMQEDIIGVCKTTGLHDFIMGLPDGYNTECGRNGSRFSGGQRQRLAIARALIRDPEILLLDEPTSQLDSQTEKEIQKAFDAASSNRTTITVSHRLASVQKSDRIFVFDQGSVAEEGTHEELLALGGIYAAMVSAQELK